MAITKEQRRAAVELLLSAGAGAEVNHGLLFKEEVPQDLASAMEQAGLLRTWSVNAACWDLTPTAHRFVNRVVSESQDIIGLYCEA